MGYKVFGIKPDNRKRKTVDGQELNQILWQPNYHAAEVSVARLESEGYSNVCIVED